MNNDRSETPKRLSPYFLEYIKVTSFGKYANLIVGPLKPGFNVIYGPNEAGKTTINELIKGVLFGWPAKRKAVNSYKPETADRVGSLFFKDTVSHETEELKRVQNTDVLVDRFGLLDDIDRETYQTIFALTSDELTRLDKHNDVTAHLLTAGSGTSASPTKALTKIQNEIKNTLSRSSQYPNSLGNLLAQQQEARDSVQEGLKLAERHQAQEKQLADLETRTVALTETQLSLNGEIESHKTALERIKSIDASIKKNQEQLDETSIFLQSTRQDFEDYGETCLSRGHVAQQDFDYLVDLDANEEYRLRNTLDDLAEERLKLEHLRDNAKRDAQRSRDAYESVVNNHDLKTEKERARIQRIIRIVVALFIAACMAAAGLWLFRRGSAVASLSFSAMGVIVCIVALITAMIGVFTSLRPTKTEEVLEEQRKNQEWVMQQDERQLAFCEQDLQDHAKKIDAWLVDHHFQEAKGSIRLARRLLDQAKEYRADKEKKRYNLHALELQKSSLETEIRDLKKERASACSDLGLVEDATIEQLESIIAQMEADREQTIKLSNETNLQYGELSSELARAKHGVAFDKDKQTYEIINARIQEASAQLMVLLLARRGLEVAISDWERRSQPEVYRRASDYLCAMTGGAWQQVRMNAAGDIEVVDAIKTARPPHLLSLGTRQQLYLALRIALLITAQNVGCALPILCDDILVNFDQERRQKAAEILLDLAQYRQVILFTCHPDVAALFQQTDSSINHLEL